jgi:Tfp pilus assembly protein PilF
MSLAERPPGLLGLGITLILLAAPAVANADTAVQDANRLYNRAAKFLEAGKPRLAGDYLLQAVAANRNHLPALLALADIMTVDERGVVYGDPVRNKKAAELYQHALDLEPESARAHNNLAWLLLQTDGDPKQALKHAEAATTLVPKHPAYLDTLAVAYCMVGEMKLARASLEKARAVQPDAQFLAQRRHRICKKQAEVTP